MGIGTMYMLCYCFNDIMIITINIFLICLIVNGGKMGTKSLHNKKINLIINLIVDVITRIDYSN